MKQPYTPTAPQESTYTFVRSNYPEPLQEVIKELQKEQPQCVGLLRSLNVNPNCMHAIIKTAMHEISKEK